MDLTFVPCTGDGQELGSIETVYGSTRTSESPLLIGSVKSNMGHTEAASGLAGQNPPPLSWLVNCFLLGQFPHLPQHQNMLGFLHSVAIVAYRGPSNFLMNST